MKPHNGQNFMMLAVTYSRTNTSIDAPLITVETHLSPGMPLFRIVGLPETAVKESRDRIRSALMTSHFSFPHTRITVNLAPASLPKNSPGLDLAIAMGILAASKQIPYVELPHYEFIGECALTGEIRAIDGILPMVFACQKEQRTLIIAKANAQDIALTGDMEILLAANLLEVCDHFHKKYVLPVLPAKNIEPTLHTDHDMIDVRGHDSAKLALCLAASGGHHLLMNGPPGSGKTMLARRLPGILPPLADEAAIAVGNIYSIAKINRPIDLMRCPPFRTPHHTSSSVALIGGGRPPKPGEISLAHHGVLFLDELPEFPRAALEALREPIETGWVHISRANHQAIFPSLFQLIAAMNPCPCGYYGDKSDRCRCAPPQIVRYQNKISGPLLDRIDLQLTILPQPEASRLYTQTESEAISSQDYRHQVIECQTRQYHRQAKLNAHLTSAELQQFCQLTEPAEKLLNSIINKNLFSTRGLMRLLKLSRTIADHQRQDKINEEAIATATSYRLTTDR